MIPEPLTVYCDATYNHPREGSATSRLHGITALVATKSDWLKSEKEWNRVLEPTGLEYFHMKDFHYAYKRKEFDTPVPESNQFYNWTLSDMDKLYKELAKVISRKKPKKGHRHLSHSCFLFRKDFKDAVPLALKKDVRCKSEYVFAAWVLVRTIANWARKNKYRHQHILYVFSMGDPEQGQLEPFFQYMKRDPNLREDFFIHWQLPKCLDRQTAMEESPQIQMADVVAHASLHNLEDGEAANWPAHLPITNNIRLQMLTQNEMTYSGLRYHKDQLQQEFRDMMRHGIWTMQKPKKKAVLS